MTSAERDRRENAMVRQALGLPPPAPLPDSTLAVLQARVEALEGAMQVLRINMPALLADIDRRDAMLKQLGAA